jgi:surface polysaccharide O-acyltransferase-like enzyme
VPPLFSSFDRGKAAAIMIKPMMVKVMLICVPMELMLRGRLMEIERVSRQEYHRRAFLLAFLLAKAPL